MFSLKNLFSITGELQNSYNQMMNKGNEIYPLVMKRFFQLLIVILICFILNLSGFGGLNVFVELLALIILTGIMLKPNIIVPLLIGAIASGVAQQPETIKEELEKFFKIYLELAKGLAFGILLIFTFLTVIPVGEFPLGFFILLGTIPAIVLAGNYWGFDGTWGKKIIYWSLIIIVGITFARFVPDTAYTKILGTTPSAMFGVTEDEEALLKYDRKAEEKAVEARAERLEDLMEKVEDGDALTEDEALELTKIRGEISRRSLPAIGGKALDKTGDAIETSASWWSSIFGKSGKSDESDDSSGTSGPRLVEVVEIRQSMFSTSLRQLLPVGRYSFSFDPAEASVGARFMVKMPDGKNLLREIRNNSASIRRGEYICGVFTKIDPATVQIFAN